MQRASHGLGSPLAYNLHGRIAARERFDLPALADETFD